VPAALEADIPLVDDVLEAPLGDDVLEAPLGDDAVLEVPLGEELGVLVEPDGEVEVEEVEPAPPIVEPDAAELSEALVRVQLSSVP
jgi:hypothetical protein